METRLKVISLDCESTGIDLHHGAMPFLVTTCAEDGTQQFWEWDVDPLTRQPFVPSSDIAEIVQLIEQADLIVLQNSKFDAAALHNIGINLPWSKVRDTLLAGHLLASNHKHNLTDMCIEYLGHDIEPLEVRVKKVTLECRHIVEREFPDWRLAAKGLEEMPSVTGQSKRDDDKPWKNDMWICRALASHYNTLGCPVDDDTWLTVTSQYANTDSAVTLPLWFAMEQEINRRGLMKIYMERLKLLPIAFSMEQKGVSISKTKTDEMINLYGVGVAQANDRLISIAAGYNHDLELPAGASPNDSLREFFYGSTRIICPTCGTERKHKEWKEPLTDDHLPCPKCKKRNITSKSHVRYNPCLHLEKVYSPKTGGITLDKDALDYYVSTLDGVALEFIQTLRDKRSRDTALSYMESYKRFWLPDGKRYADFNRLFPSVNPVGTDHLRWSSYNPNSQNISRKEDFNLRACFAPRPDREFWTMDFRNIERRIPVYESMEPKMVEVFESPDKPPYWGNLYCLTASVLYPEDYWPLSDEPDKFKRERPKLYKQAKFFDLAKQYGCGRKKGDLLAKVRNSFDLFNNEFPLFAALQQRYLDMANRMGYVETMPDRTVDSERGYPILASRTEDGRVSGTTPFNYHVSGTAMQCTNKAMIRTFAQIQQWNAQGWDGFLSLQIHDELLFDMPRGTGPEPWRTNLPRVRKLKALMEQSGDDIGLPTPVSVGYHIDSWAKETVVPI